ncbi:MAG: hypothetical protein QM719_11525 [Thermomonas sp.]
MADIPGPAKSVGAHLAAKLELFCTDERTLTDELCDMLCIWLGMQAAYGVYASGGPAFDLTVSKTTTAEEVKTGADLELFVQSPLGSKRCLIQAKVLDPVTNKLRCATKKGWQKLRKQLVDARNEVGSLAFLLVYVPMNQLDGANYGYGTYEQGGGFSPNTSVPSFYGATLIPVDDLVSKSNRWRNRKEKVPRLTTGQFKNGIPFWRLLLQLMLCRRGKWALDRERIGTDGIPSFRTVAVVASRIERDSWIELEHMADQFLAEQARDSDV